ncbi:hypothetical protein KKB83_01210 [Patescibacteria group bacterium]|nr:hypothetical protein [Patescibacteria group bacterium]
MKNVCGFIKWLVIICGLMVIVPSLGALEAIVFPSRNLPTENTPRPLSANQWQLELDHLIGTPYVDFGFATADGQWVVWRWSKSATLQTETQGLNCSGFVIEAVRRVYGQRWALEELGAPRTDLVDNSGDRYLFGYDLVMNIAEKISGHAVLSSADPGKYTDTRGFLDWSLIPSLMEEGKVYLLDLNENRNGARMDFHVALATVQSGQVWVYEATSYPAAGQAKGVGKVSWEQFVGKYAGRQIWLYIVAVPEP